MTTSLENFAEYIKPYLLETIAIKTDKKIIRKGKLKIFQVKQHYARLTLEDGERTRIYEVPYPYDISKKGTVTTLNYKTKIFLNIQDLNLQVKLLDSTKKSKLYDELVYILPLRDVD
tara:strand:- start:1981 stop:2331 length:351 start_codon:yes stop_codon:yes gene_type:complete